MSTPLIQFAAVFFICFNSQYLIIGYKVPKVRLSSLMSFFRHTTAIEIIQTDTRLKFWQVNLAVYLNVITPTESLHPGHELQ